MKKLIFLFCVSLFTFNVSLFAQRGAPKPPPSSLSANSIDLGTFTQSATPDTNNLTVSLGSGFMPLIFNYATSTDSSKLSFRAKSEMLADSISNAESIEPWIREGEQDSLLTLSGDGTYRYNNIPTELSPGFDFSYTDLLSGWDFTSGWTTSGATINSATSFSSTATSGYIYKESLITALHNYQLIISGTVTGTVNLYDGSGGGIQMRQYTSGSFNDTIIFTASATPTHADRILLLCSQSGTNVTITQLELVELIPPTGWTASTMNSSNYVIEDTEGLRLVGDGTTSVYIRLSNVFEVGKQYIIKNNTSSLTGRYRYVDGVTETQITTSGIRYDTLTAIGTYLTINRVYGYPFNAVISELSIKEYHPTNNISIGINGLEENQYYEVDFGYKEGEDQILANPDFEVNVSNWDERTTSTLVRNTTSPISGTGDAKTTLSGTNYNGSIRTTVNLDSNATYYIKFTGRLSTASNGGFYIRLNNDASPGASPNQSAITQAIIGTPTTNTTYDTVITTTDDWDYLHFASQYNTGGSRDLYVDDIAVYKLSSPSQKVEQGIPSLTWNNETTTLNALTSARQDTITRFLARGNNSDTIIVSVDDTCKFDFDISIKKVWDNFIVTADGDKTLTYITDNSTVGSFSKDITFYHTGSNNGNTATITWDVTALRELIALDGTTFDLDTSAVYVIDSLRFYNPSNVNFNVSQLGYWNGTTTLSPFGIYWNSTTIASGDTGTLYCDYTPFEDSTYASYIYIKVKSTDLITQYDTTRLSISATAVLDTVPSLGTPVLAVIDSTDGITLSWSSVDNANGYIVYGKYSGGTYDTLTFTNSTTYFDEPNELANRNYYVVAYNSLESKTSNVITTSSEPTGTVIYVKLDNSTGYDAIADVNALPDNRKVFFYTGEQFDDALLDCNTGSTYGTYGGSAKAIIGDTTKVFDIDRTIRVNVNNVTVKNLMVLGYKNESDVITFTGTDLIFKNLIVNGGDGTNAHNYGTGIKQQSSSSTNITIYGNIIRDLRDGIYIARPYNVEVAYNTMYDLYSYSGRVNYNAGTGIRQGTVQWDAEYTYWIHHNNIYNFEAMAIEHCPSNTLIEYNEIHHNLDERIFFGGPKHGNVGKLPDAGTGYTNTGVIFRYNYVHDLKKFGQPGYIYDTPTVTNIINRTIPTPLSTNNTSGNGASVPWYYGANAEGSSYGEYYGDAESPDNVISGQGYYNMWIHNNIFEDCTGKIFSHAGGYTDGTRLDYATHYVNNTILNCGTGWHARENLVTLEYTQSPLYVVNNIFDYNNSTALFLGYYKTSMLWMDYNLYTRQNSNYSVNSSPASGSNYFARYNSSSVNNWTTTNQQYSQTPDLQDTTSRFYAPHVGTGTFITDARLVKGGHSYNTGKPYDELGDTYESTSANGTIAFGGTLGEDPTGRSFAYDMLGNLRTTNDLGALGIPQDSVFQTTPTIITQPTDLYASVGDTVQFTLSTSLPNGVVQCQWWESTDIGKMQDTGKYSGTTTNTLTISGIDSTHADLRFLCEVKNPNGYPQTGYWINSDVVQVYVNGVSGISVQDTIFIASGYDDVYRKYSSLYPTLGYLELGSNIDIGLVFYGMNHYDSIDSGKVYLSANTTKDPSTVVAQWRFQLSNNTSSFIDVSDFYSRIANVTTAYDNFPTDANARVVGTFYGHDITNSLTELNNTYTFTGSEGITLFGDGDASSGLLSFKSYEGSYIAYIVIWGTR